MHTAHLLTISPSMHCAGVVCLAKGLSALPSGVCFAGVSALPEDCLVGGLPCWGDGIPTCTEADPPVNRMTDRCKNITLPQTSFAGSKNKKKIRDLTMNWTQVTCLAVSHSNHYTRMFSVLVWGCNWILFMHGSFCQTLTITLECFLCLCEAVIESYLCMGDSVNHSNHYTRMFSVLV